MFLKIRKFLIWGALGACLPVLSGCVLDSYINPPIPPVSVTEVTTPPATPDTPPLYCNIGRGSALFGRDWYDFSDVLFTLQRGEPANVKVTRVHSTQQMTIQALFDGKGQKLIFCPFLNVGEGERISCSSLYALDDDLQAGIKRTFDIPSAVRGGSITCAYAQENLKSLKTPSAGGN